MIQVNKIADKFFIDETILSNYDLQLFIVEKGEGLIIMDSRVFKFLPNRIFFIPAYSNFQIKGYVKSGYFLDIDRLLYTSFLLHNPYKLSSEFFEYPKYYVDLAYKNAKNVFLKSDKIIHELHENADFAYLKDLFTSLFLLINPQKKIGDEELSDKQQLILKFKSLIEKHFKEHRSINFYAEKVGLQSQQLNLLCREIIGKSVIEFINERLIKEAEYLLLSSDLPMKVIAKEFGFVEQLHFASYFKESRGITPTEFRNK